MTQVLLGLLIAGAIAPLALLALPLLIRARAAALVERLERENRGRSVVLARGLLLGTIRRPAVVAALEHGLEIRPIPGGSVRLPWDRIDSACWSYRAPGGGRLPDPDHEGTAPVLTVVTSGGIERSLAFRTSRAVPIAGALSRRMGDRAPHFPPSEG